MTLQDYLQQLGARIQQTRKGRQLSQKVLAQQAGLDRAYISTIERGKHNVTIGAIMKLSTALGVPLGQLLVGEQPNNGAQAAHSSHSNGHGLSRSSLGSPESAAAG